MSRIGFLGVGWIGRNRMRALVDSGAALAVGVADLDEGVRAAALEDAPRAEAVAGLDELLDLEVDGVVIATPSALHAAQAVTALERGVAVFCQKPLGRDLMETRRVLQAARTWDRLLAVDLSYRHVQAVRAIKDVIDSGELGAVYAVDLVFHNAYGPDKPWFSDRELAGGGCLIDLGTHLVDLALWLTRSGTARVDAARLLRRGAPLAPGAADVEDYAVAQLELPGGAVARLACSWWLPAGRDCAFECTVYGTAGAVSVQNVAGSFYDFRALRMRGRSTQTLVEPPDDWGGRAIVAWAQQLAASAAYDPAANELEALARVVDDIYAAGGA